MKWSLDYLEIPGVTESESKWSQQAKTMCPSYKDDTKQG